MKSLTALILLLLAGLASVNAQKATETTSRAAEETAASTTTAEGVEETAATKTTASSEAAATNTDAANIINIGAGLGHQNFDPANLGLNFGNIDPSGLNLGNRAQVTNAIRLLMNGLCVGNFFNFNNIQTLGRNQQLQLLLQLQQIQQLQRLGFLNIVDVQNLFRVGSFNGSRFNIGLFTRAVEERKKNLKRSQLRRSRDGNNRQQRCVIAEIPSTTTDAGEAAATPAETAAASREKSKETAASTTTDAAPAESTDEAPRGGAEGRR